MMVGLDSREQVRAPSRVMVMCGAVFCERLIV